MTPTGEPFLRVAAGGVTIEVGIDNGHRGYDFELRTDNINPDDGLIGAARISAHAVDEINARLKRLRVLEGWIFRPDLQIVSDWTVVPTLVGALSRGDVVFAAAADRHRLYLPELADQVGGKYQPGYRRLTTPDGRTLSAVTTNCHGAAGYLPNTVVAEASAVQAAAWPELAQTLQLSAYKRNSARVQ